MAYLTFIERYFLASVAVFFIAVPLALSLYRYSSLDKAFKLLLIFLCLDLVIGLGMFHLAAYRTNNIPLVNLFVPVRYLLFAGMFFYNFKSIRLKKVIQYTMIGFVPFTLLDTYTSNANLADLHNHMVGKYAQVVESILVILWVLLYFYEIIKTLNVTNIISYPFFWVCAGLLIFYSGNIFYFPFWYYMNRWENDLQLGFIEEIPYAVEIISLFLFSIGIWLTKSHYDNIES
ncbi:hypothetical protein [Arundinibacter roseus]|uniref:Uncharacterized protein n=1 Tax=Arundinibacter roseus TaxID=2070510 RepID=A0A4R4KIB5_9BACT|nr:hypothetical protein [Arundinibacter roseus]TDB67838.1 hypothetical protein EZE20_02635 [Arundinibacter roseus]